MFEVKQRTQTLSPTLSVGISLVCSTTRARARLTAPRSPLHVIINMPFQLMGYPLHASIGDRPSTIINLQRKMWVFFCGEGEKICGLCSIGSAYL